MKCFIWFPVCLLALFSCDTNPTASITKSSNGFQKSYLIGTWTASHQSIMTLYGPSGFTSLDTGVTTKTYRITQDSIEISGGSSYEYPILWVPSGPIPLIGTWSIKNDTIVIYPDSVSPFSNGFPPSYGTRYYLSKYLSDSLIFTYENGADTCQRQL